MCIILQPLAARKKKMNPHLRVLFPAPKPGDYTSKSHLLFLALVSDWPLKEIITVLYMQLKIK